MTKESYAAIIVAGGRGERMGANCPKQFLSVNGKEIIEYTIDTFVRSKIFSQIVVVCHKDYLAHTSEMAKSYERLTKFCVTEGGQTRQESVVCGLNQITDAEYVMIHDAVRCCVKESDILKLCSALKKSDGCVLGVKVTDTIKMSDDSLNIVSTVDRTNLWHIQTPQAFRTSVIMDAHKKAYDSGFNATDDCSVAEFAGVNVKIVEGSYSNIKITTPSDILLAQQYLKDGC